MTAECDLPADTEVILYLKTQKHACHERTRGLPRTKKGKK